MALKSSSPPQYSAPALDKGLDILECLADARLPLSHLELAQTLGRTPGEIYRMLMRLEERGYVIRESESGKFRLTLRLYELGHKQNAPMLLRRAARFPMEALADQSGQACHLSVQHGALLLVLMERMPARRVCLAVGEGTVTPLIQTSSGKVLLSRMTREAAAELLGIEPLFTEMSAPKRKAFLARIDEIRKTDCLVMESAQSGGVIDIAAPVGVPGTDAFGVLAISCLAATETGGIRKSILRFAAQINHNLGINQ
jgi:DNA-binding IclR family transcriptional regulator